MKCFGRATRARLFRVAVGLTCKMSTKRFDSTSGKKGPQMLPAEEPTTQMLDNPAQTASGRG